MKIKWRPDPWVKRGFFANHGGIEIYACWIPARGEWNIGVIGASLHRNKIVPRKDIARAQADAEAFAREFIQDLGRAVRKMERDWGVEVEE